MTIRTLRLLPMVATTVMTLAALHAAPAHADPAGAHETRTVPRPGQPGWQQVGEASYYSNKYTGRRTASGGHYNPREMTAAHPWLPLGTRLRVVREDSGRSIVVVVTDRQTPNGRVIDLSRGAAERLDLIRPGRAQVRLIALAAEEFGTESNAVLRPGIVRRHPASTARRLHAHRAAVHTLRAAGDARHHRLPGRVAGRHAAVHPVT